MGALDLIRGRDDNGRMSRPFVPPDSDGKEQGLSASPAEIPSPESVEWHDEKEIQEHPNEINASADLGLQKAEAAALVYTKKVVVGIYAW